MTQPHHRANLLGKTTLERIIKNQCGEEERNTAQWWT